MITCDECKYRFDAAIYGKCPWCHHRRDATQAAGGSAEKIIEAFSDAIEVIRIEHGCGHDTDLMASALARLLEEQPIPRAEKTRLGMLLSEAGRQ